MWEELFFWCILLSVVQFIFSPGFIASTFFLSFFFFLLRLASNICSYPSGTIFQVIPESRFELSGDQCLQLLFPTPVLHYEKYLGDCQLEKRFVWKINFSSQVTLSYKWCQMWDCIRIEVDSWWCRWDAAPDRSVLSSSVAQSLITALFSSSGIFFTELLPSCLYCTTLMIQSATL